MRLLADQDVYAVTVQYLRGLGLDVATAAERGMSRSGDADLLRIARAEGRIFVTRDRRFGGLVFVQSLGAGILYLRVLPSTLGTVHAELGRVLSLYSEAELLGTFVVVEPGRHGCGSRLWTWEMAPKTARTGTSRILTTVRDARLPDPRPAPAGPRAGSSRSTRVGSSGRPVLPTERGGRWLRSRSMPGRGVARSRRQRIGLA